jgi:hypothetical protein
MGLVIEHQLHAVSGCHRSTGSDIGDTPSSGHHQLVALDDGQHKTRLVGADLTCNLSWDRSHQPRLTAIMR